MMNKHPFTTFIQRANLADCGKSLSQSHRAQRGKSKCLLSSVMLYVLIIYNTVKLLAK